MRDDLEEVERSVRKPSRHADVNAVVGGLLRDLALAQTSPQRDVRLQARGGSYCRARRAAL